MFFYERTIKMHHLLVFNSALGVNASNSILNAAADGYFTNANNRFQIPKDLKILAGFYAAANALRGRIVTGHLPTRGYPQIHPVNRAVTPATDPNWFDSRDMPIQIYEMGDLEVQGSNNLGAATEQSYAGVWVAEDPINYNINARDLRIVRATAAVTNVAQAWSAAVAVTFEETLEAGSYGIYGLDVFAADAVFGRLVLQGQYFRPGCIARTAVGDRMPKAFMGGFGMLGRFTTYSNPQVQTFANAAGAVTAECRLLIAKL